MKTADLSKNLLGHVILWTKGWYSDISEITLERLNEITIEYCALPPDYCIGLKQTMDLVSDAAEVVGVRQKDISEAFLRRATMSTTYHVKIGDKVAVDALLWAMVSCVQCAAVDTSDIKVKLPSLLPGIKKTYDLDPNGDRESQGTK
jgi:hypothetical protein